MLKEKEQKKFQFQNLPKAERKLKESTKKNEMLINRFVKKNQFVLKFARSPINGIGTDTYKKRQKKNIKKKSKKC